MIIRKEQPPANLQSVPDFMIRKAQILPILRNSRIMPLKSLHLIILLCQMAFYRQSVRSVQFFISLKLGGVQNRYKIAIAKLKYEETKPFYVCP